MYKLYLKMYIMLALECLLLASEHAIVHAKVVPGAKHCWPCKCGPCGSISLWICAELAADATSCHGSPILPMLVNRRMIGSWQNLGR